MFLPSRSPPHSARTASTPAVVTNEEEKMNQRSKATSKRHDGECKGAETPSLFCLLISIILLEGKRWFIFDINFEQVQHDDAAACAFSC